jgi:hypothetical protein
MGHGALYMGHDTWGMVHGVWCMGHDAWSMVHGLLHVIVEGVGGGRGGGGRGRGGRREGRDVQTACRSPTALSYLNIRKYELLLDPCPDDASHLVAVHLDHRILGHNTLCCI